VIFIFVPWGVQLICGFPAGAPVLPDGSQHALSQIYTTILTPLRVEIQARARNNFSHKIPQCDKTAGAGLKTLFALQNLRQHEAIRRNNARSNLAWRE
jgi:hypothetical protein